MDWNQCFVIDCSLSHPAGTNCSHVHTTFYVTRDSIFTPFVECVFLLAFCACIYDLVEPYLFSFPSVVP